MMPIRCEVIPHHSQRYNTSGDYFVSGNAWLFCISRLEKLDYEFLVFLHELVEWWWAQKNGIKNEDIDTFDMQFEKEKLKKKHHQDDEPGDDPKCPVYRGHQIATAIERTAAELLGIDWQQYEAAFDNLWYPYPSKKIRKARQAKRSKRK